jgi:hypothetical protein
MQKPTQLQDLENEHINKRLGVNYVQAKNRFYKTFPDGSEFTQDRFQKWQVDNKFGEYDSNQLRYGISKAAIREDQENPFVIVRTGKSSWQVISTTTAVAQSNFETEISHLIKKQEKDLIKWMIHIDRDWDTLAEKDQFSTVMVYAQFKNFKAQIMLGVSGMADIKALADETQLKLKPSTRKRLPSA